MLCLAFIFHLQPGCNYSIDVTSDEDSDIDHSLPRSRIVKVGSMHQTVMYMYTYAHVFHGIFWEHECLLLVNTTKVPSMWVVFLLRQVFMSTEATNMVECIFVESSHVPV